MSFPETVLFKASQALVDGQHGSPGVYLGKLISYSPIEKERKMLCCIFWAR